MLTFRIRSNFPEVRAAWKNNETAMRAATLRGVHRAALLVQKVAQQRLTANRSVNFGLLRASIGVQVDEAKLTAQVGPGLGGRSSAGLSGNPVNYGFFVEHGRRAGRFPPPIALGLWVRRKLGVSDPKALRRATYLVGRKIAQRGIVARPFLAPAMNETAVRTILVDEISKTIRELNGKR